MENFTITDSDNGKSLSVSGEVTIQNAGSFRDSLKKLYEDGSNVTIHLEELTNADLTFLQILCSAHRTFTSSGKALTISGPCPQVLKKVIEDAGYQRGYGCALDTTKTCLWMRRI
ncbi:MAG: hypothetical protein CSYNP_00900 [Syntrophus sp. SKADARSKE-3]|nr:hypothetical protein [Syntrophus sp. SKADARSKE-3]